MKKYFTFIVTFFIMTIFAMPVSANSLQWADLNALLPSAALPDEAANHTAMSLFAMIAPTDATYEITVVSGAGGSISPASATVNCGENQIFTITPDTGYEIEDVTVDGISQGAVTSYEFTNVTAAHTITATFKILTYKISVIPSFGGNVSPSTTDVTYGGSQTFTITPDNGCEVYSIKVDGVVTGSTDLTYTFTNVTANHTISVTFLRLTYGLLVNCGSGGSISPGTTTVSYNGSKTFTITPDTGCKIDDVKVDGNSVGAITSYTFSNVKEPHTISATFKRQTFTITASTGENGSVSPTTATVAYGDDQTFTITPDTGFAVDDVKIDDISQGAVTSYTFSGVSTNHAIVVTFKTATYDISAIAGDHGNISPTTATVSHGGSQIFTITPDSDYEIKDVTVDGVSVGAVSSYTFRNVTASHTITAAFQPATPTSFTITARAGENGSVSPSSATVNYGDDQTFTITPNTGFAVDDVRVDDVSLGAVTSYTFHDVTTTHIIAATFKTATYEITATAGDHGNISPASATVSHGDNQIFTITPDNDYEIKDVTADGVSVGAIASYTFSNVTADHIITAVFKPLTPTVISITVSAGAGGFVSPSVANVNYGDDLTFDIMPNAGFDVDDVKVDGVSVGAVYSYTFSNVTKPHSIAATFKAAVYTIRAETASHGSISPSSTTVDYGGERTFTITPDTGYVIDDVKVDDVSQGAITSYDFTNVTATHAISATFKLQTFAITVNTGSGGNISPTSATVDYGGERTFTITPDTGYVVDDVKVDNVSQGAITSYDFTNVTATHAISATFKLQTFAITVNTGSGGAISPTSATVNYGNDQTFTITPNTGYEIKAVTVDGVSQGTISTYTFTNVKATHTITATFKQKITLSFTDVPTGCWYEKFVNDLVGKGILSGYKNNDGTYTFHPDNTITRAEFATILAKASGEDLSGYANKTSFNDVPATYWGAKYIEWAFQNHIVSGVGSGKYDPEANITRQEMAVMIYRFATAYQKENLPQKNAALTFTDNSSIASWGATAVSAMQQAGVINGIDNGNGSYRFEPGGNAQRSAAATMISIYLGL